MESGNLLDFLDVKLKIEEVHIDVDNSNESDSVTVLNNKLEPNFTNIEAYGYGEQSEDEFNNEGSRNCKICSKKFATQATCLRHERLTHSGKKEWKCNLCDNEYKYKTSLKVHMLKDHSLTPPDPYPFKCTYCPKGFPRNCVLQKHITKYHELPPVGTPKLVESPPIPVFTCNLCPKAYRDNTGLQRHIRHVHENKRLWKCSSCEKSFNTKSTLDYHLETHKPQRIVKVFECYFCNKHFWRPGQLKEHVKLNHPNEFNASIASPSSNSVPKGDADDKEELILGF